MKHLSKLISKDLVIGLQKPKFEKDRLCDACHKGYLVSFTLIIVLLKTNMIEI